LTINIASQYDLKTDDILDIINRFLSGLPHLNDIHILTNEELNGQLQNHLPSIISIAGIICIF